MDLIMTKEDDMMRSKLSDFRNLSELPSSFLLGEISLEDYVALHIETSTQLAEWELEKIKHLNWSIA
jgi:hypothetical protein